MNAQIQTVVHNMIHTMRTKRPNKCAGSLLIPCTLHKCAVGWCSPEHTRLHCTFLLQSSHFSSLCSSSTPFQYQLLHSPYHLHLSHWTSSLYYQLHKDMKFLAVTSYRCEKSHTVTALVSASSGLCSLFHLLARRRSRGSSPRDMVKTPTGFLLGESEVRLRQWGLFVAQTAEGYPVICCSLHVSMRGLERTEGGLQKRTMNACFACRRPCMWWHCMHKCRKGRMEKREGGWGRRETRRCVLHSSESIWLMADCLLLRMALWSSQETTAALVRGGEEADMESLSSCIFIHLVLCFV